jgi:Transposase
MIGAVLECCAGIDVGKKFVVVCLMTGPADGEAHEQTRKYATNNGDLEKLRDWLRSCGCFHVVMESTGAYWKPIFNILEEVEGMQVVLANSQQVKNLRGHKTDPNDSRWLAHLLRQGMIRPSYIPPRAIRELRDSGIRLGALPGAPWLPPGVEVSQRYVTYRFPLRSQNVLCQFPVAVPEVPREPPVFPVFCVARRFIVRIEATVGTNTPPTRNSGTVGT